MAVEPRCRSVLLVAFGLCMLAMTAEAQICPENWIAYLPTRTCIQLSQVKQNFLTAKSVCESLGAKLVKITDAGMDGFLHNRIRGTGQGHYIGLNDRSVEGSYRWNDETSQASYVNWEPGQPNNGGGQDCVTLRNADGKWNDSPCEEKKRFICEKPPISCPTGWFPYGPGNTCLFLSTNKRNFLTARSACASANAKLVKITDAGLDNFLFNKIKGTGQGHYIGLNDRSVEGKYRWNDETTEASYLNWEPGQPNNGHGQDCVTLRNADGTWNDSGCWEKKRYICQKPPQQ